jgi:4-hydroxybenzoate polyprenyltransferase
MKSWVKAARLHQWLKNLLLFTPLLAAHQERDLNRIWHLVAGFFAFSLLASGVYLINDLIDIDSDRKHPRKKNRPFASGALTTSSGWRVAPLLLLMGLGLATTVGRNFFIWLLIYLAITVAYSLFLKRLVIVDGITLATLYFLRIVAGASASKTSLSFYLATFSIFLFLSLAFVKRYAELRIASKMDSDSDFGRGYLVEDAPIVQVLGVASGYAAVVILALYLNTDYVHKLYAHPQLVWGLVPVLLYWISWVWLKAHRGEMNDDPLLFAVKNRESQMAGLVFLAVLIASSVGR